MNKMDTTKIFEEARRVKQHSPIVHNITNYVAMDISANILLAIGASPIMSHYVEEFEELINIANALCINIGTLDDRWIKSYKAGAMIAKELNKPVVLDPVGAGATTAGTNLSYELLESGAITVLRGNASEVMSLANFASCANGDKLPELEKTTSRGVDSSSTTDQAVVSANYLANKYSLIVATTGRTDLVVNAEGKNHQSSYGDELMTKVTALGCSLSSVIAAFIAQSEDRFNSTVSAIDFYNLAAEEALSRSKGFLNLVSSSPTYQSNERFNLNRTGPGIFAANFIDSLYSINLD